MGPTVPLPLFRVSGANISTSLPDVQIGINSSLIMFCEKTFFTLWIRYYLILQSVPLAISPKPLSSRYLFRLVKKSNSIHFVITTSLNHWNCVFGLVNQKVFGTDCYYSESLNEQVSIKIKWLRFIMGWM